MHTQTHAHTHAQRMEYITDSPSERKWTEYIHLGWALFFRTENRKTFRRTLSVFFFVRFLYVLIS